MTNDFDGTGQKGKYETNFFHDTMSGTVMNPFGRPGVLVTTASKHSIHSGYSKFGPYINILYRNLGRFTA